MEDSYKYIYDNIQVKPIIPKKTYPLNKDNIKLYLDNSNEKFVPILKKLFDNTTHISYKVFKFILYNNFRELIYYCKKRNIKVISLYLDKIDYSNITQKSNFWVAQHFYEYLKKKKINIKLNIIYNYKDIKYLDDGEFILILDDCSYTGYQLSSVLETKLNHNKNFDIYIIIAFITKNAIKLLKNTKTTNNIIISKNNTIINDFYHYLTDAEKQIAISQMYMSNKYPIYFDHKLADTVSTYTIIYSGKIINSNKIIPIITNCEHIKELKDINEMSPACPISPYKINSADFDNNKDNIKIKSSSLYSTFSSISNKSLNKSFKKLKSKNYHNNFNLIHYKDYISFIENKKTNFIVNIKNKNILKLYEIFKSPPKIPEKSYNLNSARIKKYYDMILPDIVPLVKKVINNTVYMSYPVFIKDLLEKIEKLQIYLNKHNIKTIKLFISYIETTNRWVSHIIYHNLKDINIIIINKHSYINKDDIVVYADDFIFNQNRIKFFFNIKKNKLPSYTIYIIASYISNRIFNKLKSYLKITNPNPILILSDNIKSIYPLSKYLTTEEINKYYSYVVSDLSDKYAIYGDHNMYGNYTTPIFIYHGLIIDKNYDKYGIDNKYYSLINNCNKKNIDMHYPNCPLSIFTEDNIDNSSSTHSNYENFHSDNKSSDFLKSSSKNNSNDTNIKKIRDNTNANLIKKVKIRDDKTDIKIKKINDYLNKKIKKNKEDKKHKIRDEKTDIKIKKINDYLNKKIKKNKEDKKHKIRDEKTDINIKKINDYLNKKERKKCPDKKILNPDTNRCVNIDGKIGKKIINKK